MDQNSNDIFYLFIQRLFDKTNSKELISLLLEKGFDQWEQTAELNESLLKEIEIPDLYRKTILEIIQDLKINNKSEP